MIKKTDIRGCLHKLIFLTVISFILLLCCFTMTYAAENKGKDTDEVKNNIFTLYGLEMGKVDQDGIIYNKFGKVIGTVDNDGIIYNISKLEIGRVKPDGSVMNQIGTKLGSVNEQGDIINVSGRKIGSVKDISNINFTGGAARLIFFKGG